MYDTEIFFKKICSKMSDRKTLLEESENRRKFRKFNVR